MFSPPNVSCGVSPNLVLALEVQQSFTPLQNIFRGLEALLREEGEKAVLFIEGPDLAHFSYHPLSCNVFLMGLSLKTVQKLHLVQNAAADVLTGSGYQDPVTSPL